MNKHSPLLCAHYKEFLGLLINYTLYKIKGIQAIYCNLHDAHKWSSELTVLSVINELVPCENLNE